MRLLLFRNRRIDVRSLWGFLSEREFRVLSSIFGGARKYGSGYIGQVILIGWKCSVTLTVKLSYAPNKNSSFCYTFKKFKKEKEWKPVIRKKWNWKWIFSFLLLITCFLFYIVWWGRFFFFCFFFLFNSFFK